MQSHALEKRGTIVSGIAWEPTKLPQQRICGCGRKIARISHSDICQRCVDFEFRLKIRSGDVRLGLLKVPRTPVQPRSG